MFAKHVAIYAFFMGKFEKSWESCVKHLTNSMSCINARATPAHTYEGGGYTDTGTSQCLCKT